jgi:hypothetical protein
MKRDATNITRQQYAARREARAAWRAERAEAQARRDQAAIDALARYAPRSRQSGAPVCPQDASQAVFRRAPRLAIWPYRVAVERLMGAASLRGGWEPRGRGRDALFRSLATHQLARYPTPALLWSVFFNPFVEPLVPLVVHVAAGGSLFEYVGAGDFPVPLTRRMCHELLATPFRGAFLHAIRRVEVRSVGGDDRLYEAWMRTRAAQRLGTRDEEWFWLTVLGWFAKSSTFDPSRVAPLVDYIAHRRTEDAAFSMTGRSLPALVRGMEQWHRDLAREQVVHGVVYEASGFEPMALEVKQRDPAGGLHRGIWRVDEVRTGKDLAAEGRRMGHCVYSYARSVESGQTSIWSMTLEDGRGATGRWAMLTIEVRNDLRRVVQARGRFNRPATSAEHQILLRWAGMNRLSVSL